MGDKKNSVISSHMISAEHAGAHSRLHKQLAEHHRKLAQAARDCGQALNKAKRDDDDEAGDCFEKLATEYEATAATHDKAAKDQGELADRFTECAQALTSKAAGAGDALPGSAIQAVLDHPLVEKAIRERVMKLTAEAVGNQIRPDGISGVIDYKSVRAVPRVGQRELSAEGSAAVDPALSKIVGIEQ